MPPWKENPIFCLTSDVDWASEAAIRYFHASVSEYGLPLTYFITHHSQYLTGLNDGTDFGIHPNFLPGSSHGSTFDEVIKTCLQFLPQPLFFRCHKYFDVDDTNVKLMEIGCKFDSNLCTLMDRELKPLTHRLGLIRLPVFWEDGATLTHRLPLDFKVLDHSSFTSPGLKILNMHPMHYALNTPNQLFARNVKDNTVREKWSTFSAKELADLQFAGSGIRHFIDQMLAWIGSQGFQIMTLREIYLCHLENDGSANTAN